MSVVGNSDAESSDDAVSCSCSKATKDEEETAFEVPRPLQNHHRGLLKVPEDAQAHKKEQKQEENRPKPLFNDSKLRWKNEPPWTEEKHRSYLNSMEEAFVRSLYGHGYRCSYPCNKRWQLSDKTVASQLVGAIIILGSKFSPQQDISDCVSLQRLFLRLLQGAKSKFSCVHIQETKPRKRTRRFKPRDDVDHHSNQVIKKGLSFDNIDSSSIGNEFSVLIAGGSFSS
eukprot:TRINITY_DN597_c0_g1_i3.p1 TRINITY_DN597_c0_g1~~TRINITY_DN597_c0_g1_i3.p1  ORF type:complete len:253 (+),score=42.31 TRINITY_DN597_c0_g1_i3:78-761(+)